MVAGVTLMRDKAHSLALPGSPNLLGCSVLTWNPFAGDAELEVCNKIFQRTPFPNMEATGRKEVSDYEIFVVVESPGHLVDF